MIDLHTHTTASDGTDAPAALLDRAEALGLEALAITDHDTFAGADDACRALNGHRVELVRGIELSTRILNETEPSRRNAHLLGYFFREPSPDFRAWVEGLRGKRRERNAAIASNLRRLGMEITLEEAEAIGRNITGRPHFARVLLEKGYVRTLSDAYRKFLGEDGLAYVEREDPSVEEGIARIRAAGGLVSLAHPGRLNQPSAALEEALVARLAAAGLDALEVWHSDHDSGSASRFLQLARKYGLAATGGSDYHGEHKPGVLLGRGRNRLRVPLSVLDNLRRRAAY
jgi:predicted metal-dependent phosphoesterase TrpH